MESEFNRIFKSRGYLVTGVALVDNGIIVLVENKADANAIARDLVLSGAYINQVVKKERGGGYADIEEYFFFTVSADKK